jgi:hypothetical protein
MMSFDRADEDVKRYLKYLAGEEEPPYGIENWLILAHRAKSKKFRPSELMKNLELEGLSDKALDLLEYDARNLPTFYRAGRSGLHRRN